MQNCLIFNDKVWEEYTDKKVRSEKVVYLENGQPAVYGAELDKSLVLGDSMTLETDTQGTGKAMVHDTSNQTQAWALATAGNGTSVPLPMGVLYETFKPTYEEALLGQEKEIMDAKQGRGLEQMFNGGETWQVGA